MGVTTSRFLVVRCHSDVTGSGGNGSGDGTGRVHSCNWQIQGMVTKGNGFQRITNFILRSALHITKVAVVGKTEG